MKFIDRKNTSTDKKALLNPVHGVASTLATSLDAIVNDEVLTSVVANLAVDNIVTDEEGKRLWKLIVDGRDVLRSTANLHPYIGRRS